MLSTLPMLSRLPMLLMLLMPKQACRTNWLLHRANLHTRLPEGTNP